MIKKQRGVTLIELLVSMVLAVSLAAGLSQLFVQSQTSFKLQRNLSDMTDDASFILEELAKGVNQAGAPGNDTTFRDVADNSVLSSGISLAEDEYIHGTDNEFIYRFKLSSSTELDTFVCNATLKTSAVIGNTITVRIYTALDSSDPKIPVFYCKVKGTTSGTQAAEPLISEVEKLEIRYVVRSGTSSPYTFYTTTASNVVDWKQVIAIKVYVVLRSVDDKLTKNKATYKIEDSETTATDNRLYKVFSKTIKLRSTDH